MTSEIRIDRTAAIIAIARRQHTPQLQPPSPSKLQRFLDFTSEAVDEFLEFIKKPNIRERVAALTATCGVLGGSAIIGLGITGILAAVVSVKGAIALIVLGAILVGVVFTLAYVTKGD